MDWTPGFYMINLPDENNILGDLENGPISNLFYQLQMK